MKDVTSSPPPYFSSTEGSADSAKEENGETIMPLTEERLNVSKKETIEEATVIKESVKETKTVEVQLTHEELIIEKRKPSSSSGDTTTIASSSHTSEDGYSMLPFVIHQSIALESREGGPSL
jgi:stress response protein YsnF